MNVYITGTPEIPFTLIEDVCKVLNAPKGLMRFIPTVQLKQKELSSLNNSFDHLDQKESMSFDMFFSLCQINRTFHKLYEDDYIVVLSSIRNEQDWFSATKNKDIFIDTNDWDQFTGNNPIYGITYQVVENIFQSLLGIFYNNAKGHTNVHLENEGCINDFCEDKKSIKLKLRTADICKSCEQKANELNVSSEILDQIEVILKNIQENVRNLKRNKNIKFELINVTSRGEVIIGSKIIQMSSLPRTLFITFLKQTEAISKTSLGSKKDEILKIYQILKGSDNESAIDRLVDPNGKTFRQSKWAVNYALGNELDETILSEYVIDEEQNNKYLIRISPEYRKLEI